MLHPEMSGADDLETTLAGPLAANDPASVPLPAPASSNLPFKKWIAAPRIYNSFSSPSLLFPLFRRRSAQVFFFSRRQLINLAR